MKLTEKQMRILSIAATIMAVGMYVSYIPQSEFGGQQRRTFATSGGSD